MSLRRLGVDPIDLFQLHRIDRDFPLADQVGELLDAEGGARSATSACRALRRPAQAAQKIAEIVSVQNMYNLAARGAEPLLDAATDRASASSRGSRWPPGRSRAADGPLQRIAAEHDATPSQLALAWLLKRSPVMLPIPGTSSVAHLEENVAAAEITLSDDEFEALSTAGAQSPCDRPPRVLRPIRCPGGREHQPHRGGGFNPPEPTTKGGPDYGEFIDAVRRCGSRRAVDAPEEVITEAADLMEECRRCWARSTPTNGSPRRAAGWTCRCVATS